MTTEDCIAVEYLPGIAILTLNSPRTMNCLSTTMLQAFSQTLTNLARNTELRALIITGSGKAFIAGADIVEMTSMTPLEAREFSILGNAVFQQIASFPTPVIAAVNGFALGGGLECALSADFIYASSRAKLGLPEVTLGLIPGFGGSKRLSDRIGTARAKELIFTGRHLKAEEALEWGIVNKVVEPEQLLEAATETAQLIAKASPNAVKEAKALLSSCQEAALSDSVTLENQRFGLMFSHPDAADGLTAFTEKRDPKWRFTLCPTS